LKRGRPSNPENASVDEDVATAWGDAVARYLAVEHESHSDPVAGVKGGLTVAWQHQPDDDLAVDSKAHSEVTGG
jgi:hypothetical protein